MKITIINVGNFENSNEPEVLLYTPMLLDINNPFFEILLNTFDIFEYKNHRNPSKSFLINLEFLIGKTKLSSGDVYTTTIPIKECFIYNNRNDILERIYEDDNMKINYYYQDSYLNNSEDCNLELEIIIYTVTHIDKPFETKMYFKFRIHSIKYIRRIMGENCFSEEKIDNLLSDRNTIDRFKKVKPIFNEYNS